MSILLLLLFLFLLCIVIATLALGIYAVSPYGKGFSKPVAALRPGERMGLYFAAAYPVVSLVASVLISHAMKVYPGPQHASPSYFLFFGGQSVLSAYAVSVCWYLRRNNRAFNILLVTSLMSGACYLFMVSFAFWI